jgi:dimethylhistidine N-methyltransferase
MVTNRPTQLVDAGPGTSQFLRDVLAGMNQQPKRLPCKYLYDRLGCELFDQICELDEYYLTRTELAIMEKHAVQMAKRLGRQAMVIELGSGSGTKTRILLDHLWRPAAYVPVDIACDHLQNTADELADQFADLEILPVCADFMRPFELPLCKLNIHRHVVYFPGSTIGNFEAREASTLLQHIAQLVAPGGGLLIGLDLQKDRETLEAAYNDARGVTAEFNLNLLRRINQELGADFDLDGYQHLAVYNELKGRIEIYVRSLRQQTVTVGDQTFDVAEGERICTEYSHKYELRDFAEQAFQAGLRQTDVWTDTGKNFAVVYLEQIDAARDKSANITGRAR